MKSWPLVASAGARILSLYEKNGFMLAFLRAFKGNGVVKAINVYKRFHLSDEMLIYVRKIERDQGVRQRNRRVGRN
jgi:hypothetical protein